MKMCDEDVRQGEPRMHTPAVTARTRVSDIRDEVELTKITVGNQSPAAVFSDDPAIDFGNALLSGWLGHTYEMPSPSV